MGKVAGDQRKIDHPKNLEQKKERKK